jgi:hypothetical protein
MLSDADTYWHLAAGRWIVSHGSIPRTDPFSHSMPGAPWTAHEWLSEVVMAQLRAAFGWSGLIGMVAVCAALAYALITRFLLDRMQPVHALGFVALVFFMTKSHMLARPHILTWPLIAWWVSTLLRCVERRESPPLLLAALIVPWANLHGSFVLALAFAVAFAVEAITSAADGKRATVAWAWARFIAAASLLSLVTPHGIEGWRFAAHVTTMSALHTIREWQPPRGPAAYPLELFLGIVVALALAGKLRITLWRIVLLLGLSHMALKHGRYISILGLTAPLLMARGFGGSFGTAPSPGDVSTLDRWFANLARPMERLPAALTVVAVGSLIIVMGLSRSRAPIAEVSPAAALAAARAAGVVGPVWNAYDFGGYLIDQGIPVFIDGRADMYGDDFVAANVRATMLADKDALPKLLERYRIGWSIQLPGAPALALLDRLEGWERIYEDRIAVVHRRKQTDDHRP